MAQAAGIFVSHASEDNAWCRGFVKALRQAGADVWYDEHNLGYGALQEEIEREMRARPIFIVILSPASVNKPWVRREMTGAINLRDRDSTRVILPVVAEKTEIPLFWQEYKRVSAPGDSGMGAQEAAGRVVHMLAIVPAEAPAAPTPPQAAYEMGTLTDLIARRLWPPAQASETDEEAYERGQGLYAQKRYEEALEAFERALALDPESDVSWDGKGRALNKLGRNEEALVAYDRALALDPQSGTLWSNKGNALCALARYKEALVAYDRALALGIKAPNTWTGRGCQRRLRNCQNRRSEVAALLMDYEARAAAAGVCNAARS